MPLSRHGDATLLWRIPSARGAAVASKAFPAVFQTELKYMLWLGETASLKGNECIRANCVAAVALEELG
jgi:hypothetical protein